MVKENFKQKKILKVINRYKAMAMQFLNYYQLMNIYDSLIKQKIKLHIFNSLHAFRGSSFSTKLICSTYVYSSSPRLLLLFRYHVLSN